MRRGPLNPERLLCAPAKLLRDLVVVSPGMSAILAAMKTKYTVLDSTVRRHQTECKILIRIRLCCLEIRLASSSLLCISSVKL